MQSRGKFRCIGDRASYGASRKRASFQGTARGLARLRWARPSQAKTALSPLSIATLDILAPTAMPTAARRSLHPLDASAHHAGRAYVWWCVGEGERTSETSEGLCVCLQKNGTHIREALDVDDRRAERRMSAGAGGQRVLEHVEKGRWGEGEWPWEHHGSPETVIVAAQTSSICLACPSLPLLPRLPAARPPVRHAGNVTRQSKMPPLVVPSPTHPCRHRCCSSARSHLAAHPRPAPLAPLAPKHPGRPACLPACLPACTSTVHTCLVHKYTSTHTCTCTYYLHVHGSSPGPPAPTARLVCVARLRR
ncbi:hypothetical protein COCMIDRAFT_22143 [Bipolaris oryzae ATCC 44560]|uniref:Uncharacterized protein n=1 Tax=Bipolaris oryzae ATCC 44560 TaxID=930090 RepID=W6ZRY7_COCMI|nr:uncharacterized protein COCMIDRAFT_22143 [Bipolaris oryzae ATCC 44560]EUC50264.1 hypothetical protein COCMIDRAFT_22143 [Bipolaris oryzae ATCC 44560]